MRRLLLFLVPVLLLLVSPAPAAAVTWDVPGEAPTIQAGIDSAAAGDTVLVTPFTYPETLTMKSGVYVISTAGPESTIIYAGESGTAVTFTNLALTAYLEGFTIRNGLASYGGGIRCFNSNPEITNCRIVDNYAVNNGGGILCELGSGPTFTSCIIAGNTSGNNGGALLGQPASSTTFESCTFYGNGASGSGVLYLDNASADIQNSIIAKGTGGGAVQCVGTGSVTIACSDVYGNVGGDWVDCIAGQNGVNGNFSAYPRFCDPAEGDFTLNELSPCLDAPGCGRVGALGQGCRNLRTWVVPDDALTIQAGIDSCIPGDTVMVRCGTYQERISATPGLHLISETGEADCVTIDGEALGTVVSCRMAADTVIYIDGFTITNGAGYNGGGVACTTSTVYIHDCIITGNTATAGGGGINAQGGPGADAYLYMDNCEVTDNSADGDGGGVFTLYLHLELSDCLITGNTCGGGGGGIASPNSAVSLLSCIVGNNTGGTSGGGGHFSHALNFGCDLCTFSGNDAPLASGIHVQTVQHTTMDRTIIAFGGGGCALHCQNVTSVTLTCSDIYGNEGGDYVGCLAGMETTGNNIWADPIFCDPDNGDFHLGIASPCIGGTCGQIGALGAGCEDPMLQVLDVVDVGNDQGRNARVTWQRSSYDAAGSAVSIAGYGVYRRQDAHLTNTGIRSEPARFERGPGGAPMAQGWDYAGGVPARGDSFYQYVVPTLCDSTDEGICWSVLMVSAETSDPLMYFDSDPDSGYSVDNLVPAAPPGLAMTSPTELAWEEVPDEDFDYYSVFGSAAAELDETATLIGYTIDLTKDITSHVYDYYHVTATDFSGNEGEESSVDNPFAMVPDVPAEDVIPTAFALRQNQPNPFDATTVIGFDVPEAGHVSLAVFDAQGRVVVVLEDRKCEPGRHAAVWNGKDAHGNMVATGIYFVRMTAGGFEAMNKVMLLR